MCALGIFVKARADLSGLREDSARIRANGWRIRANGAGIRANGTRIRAVPQRIRANGASGSVFPYYQYGKVGKTGRNRIGKTLEAGIASWGHCIVSVHCARWPPQLAERGHRDLEDNAGAYRDDQALYNVC
jgi:hypothetical protein